MRARIPAAAAAAAALLLAGPTACAKDEPSAMAQHPSQSPAPRGDTTKDTTTTPELAQALATARGATARYVADLPAAMSDGYQVITPMMPGMGYHYLNTKAPAFDLTTPAILVYVKDKNGWQLGALEWVWPEQPTEAPLPGATYGSFDAACHYLDGTFVPAAAETDCAKSDGGSPFGFWHPKLVTLHVWLWFHNPAGLYHPTNPLIQTA
jgi:hypothetical protein